MIIGTAIIVVGIFALGGFLLWQQSQEESEAPCSRMEDIVNGVYKNELVISRSVDNVETIVKEFGGKIDDSVPLIFIVKFPVSDLSELDHIKDQLSRRGVQATYSYAFCNP